MSKELRSQSLHFHSQSIITPPDSFIDPSSSSSSTSPPATNPNLPKRDDYISNIIDHIQNRRSGHAPSVAPWLVFPLPLADFEILLTKIKADKTLWEYFQHKLRYDYSSRSNVFSVRMPTSTHEFIIGRIAVEIEKQLDNIAPAAGIKYLCSPRLELVAEDTDDEDGAGDVCGHVSVRNNPEIRKPTAKYDTHDPDAAFGCPADRYPGVVLEVVYSQKVKNMKYIAEEYILGSDGNIRAVVALNLDYHQSKRATLSVWRPELVKGDDGSEELVCELKVAEKPFRNKQGRPAKAPNAGLELQLRDFSTTTRTADINTANRIYIPPQFLCDIVTQAEDGKIGRLTEGTMIRLAPGARKRKRPRTPPEELASGDEHRFAQQEEREANRAEMEDDDYLVENAPHDV